LSKSYFVEVDNAASVNDTQGLCKVFHILAVRLPELFAVQ
jgi:hypothetical protein